MPFDLQIAPGNFVGGCIQQALNLPSGHLLDNGDLLSCGPLPPLRNLDEWINLREKYARSLYPGFDFTFAGFERDLLTHPEIVRRADSVTLWLGTGLAEQLLLVWMPQFLRLLDVDPAILRVIQFSSLPGYGSEIQSIGILDPEVLKDHPAPTAVDSDSLAILDEAWAAVTANEPWPLVDFVAEDAAPLPFLKRSLRSLLIRFPHVETGLSDLQTSILEMVDEQGPSVVRVIGYTIIRTIDALDWVGDAQLFAWLKALGSPAVKHPLVFLSGDLTNMRETTVSLTESGERVLAQELNFVTLNGIDEWIGGIHLDSSAERVWFQRNGVIVADHLLNPV